MSREKDIQELCNQVLEMSTKVYYNNNGRCEISCPLCNARKYGEDVTMNDLEHKNTCAYLIAKDLNTLMPYKPPINQTR